MADEFDGCECIWSHELATRRLLTLIRQGQSYCTDTECLDLTRNPSNNEPESFIMLVLFFIFVGLLYCLRPNEIFRSNRDSNGKHEEHPPSSSGQDPNNGPPSAVN